MESYASGSIGLLKRRELPEQVRQLAETECNDVLLLPLVPTDRSPASPPVGLLLCAGKSSGGVSGLPQCGTFLWEDIALLEFFGDMLTVLVRMLRGRDDASLRVERTLHGAKTVLGSIRDNLALLEENRASELVPPILRHNLPNSIALLDDIAAQLERKRLSSLEKLDLSDDTHIFSEILAPMASLAPNLARALGRHGLKVNNLKEQELDQIPVVRSNTSALLTVFRNMVHNSVKYLVRGKQTESWMHFSGKFTAKSIEIFVSDNGIGFPVEERELVFVEGFRSANAVGVDPTGLGIGLSDCREVMRLLGGSINAIDPAMTDFGQATTTFHVTMPIEP